MILFGNLNEYYFYGLLGKIIELILLNIKAQKYMFPQKFFKIKKYLESSDNWTQVDFIKCKKFVTINICKNWKNIVQSFILSEKINSIKKSSERPNSKYRHKIPINFT